MGHLNVRFNLSDGFRLFFYLLFTPFNAEHLDARGAAIGFYKGSIIIT